MGIFTRRPITLALPAAPAPAPKPGLLAKRPPAVQVERIYISDTARRPAYRDLPISSLTDWSSVTAVRAALNEHAEGRFYIAAMLWETMAADDRIGGCLSQRFDGLLGLPMEMRPPTGDEEDDAALELAQAATEAWPRIAPESTSSDLLSWGRGLGIGVAEKLWDTGETWTPRLKLWHPRFIAWRWDTKSFWVNTADGQIEIPERDAHWMTYAPHGYARGWMKALVRALAIPWLIRCWCFRDWARYSEVHGLPIKKGIVPADAKEEDKERFVKELSALASETTIRVPQGGEGNNFDVELIEALSTNWEGFDRLIEKCDGAIAVRILGQSLTTDVSSKGGNRALGQVHERVQVAILKADAGTLSTSYREQVMTPWAALNFGAPELAPWPTWAAEPDEDLGAAATTVLTVAQALASLRLGGAPVDGAALCERFSIPLLDGEEWEEPVAPAGPGDDGEPDDGKDPVAASAVALGRARLGAAAGQIYVDALADHGRARAARLLAPDRRVVLAAIKDATSYDDLRMRLLAAYRGMRPDRLARLMEKSLVLAKLMGRHSVLEDL